MKRWVFALLLTLLAPTAYAQTAFNFRQVWPLLEPLAPGEAEIMCFYEDRTLAVMFRNVPTPEEFSERPQTFLLRTTEDRLREAVGDHYRRWIGPPDGGGTHPMYDCNADTFANAPLYEDPIANYLPGIVDFLRNNPNSTYSSGQ